jgi:hypothetical protein
VTSDLARKIKSRNHGRGSDGWLQGKAPRAKALIQKILDISSLTSIFCWEFPAKAMIPGILQKGGEGGSLKFLRFPGRTRNQPRRPPCSPNIYFQQKLEGITGEFHWQHAPGFEENQSEQNEKGAALKSVKKLDCHSASRKDPCGSREATA